MLVPLCLVLAQALDIDFELDDLVGVHQLEELLDLVYVHGAAILVPVPGIGNYFGFSFSTPARSFSTSRLS